MHTAESEWAAQEYNELEKAFEIDQNTFSKIIRRKKNKGPATTYQMKFGGKVFHTSHKIAEGWAGYFTNLDAKLECDDFDNEFREEIELHLVDMKNNPIIFNEILHGEVKKRKLLKQSRR